MKAMKMMKSSLKVEEEANRRRPPSPDDARKYLSMRERIKQEIRKRRNTLSTSVVEHADNYGSFFGPSETHIAKRVIEESKSLLAKIHLPLLSISNSNVGQKKMVSTGTKTRSIPLLNKEQYMEVQKLRDYSFLFSDDGDPPAPAKSVKVMDKSDVDRNSNTRCQGRKSMPAHAVLRKSSTTVLKPHRDSRNCNERPKDLPSSRNSRTVMEKKQVKQTSPHVRPNKRTAAQIYDDYDHEENAKALTMIRRMFNTQRFADRDDGDCIMETSFDEIMKEERRSAKIARKEDQEQIRLIAEEEQKRKSAKK